MVSLIARSLLSALLFQTAVAGIFRGAAMNESHAGENQPATAPMGKDGKVFLVEHSHSDIAWGHSVEGESAVRNRNLEAVFAQMRKDPTFRWTIECVLYYRNWIEKHPETEAELLGYFREKRLDCGGSYTQPLEDCLYDELLARQMYVGKRWFEQRNTGIALDIVLHQDGPLRGHQTQQVYAKAGVRYLKGSRMDTPGFFHWRSPDGSSLLAWMQPGYWGKPKIDSAYIEAQLRAWEPFRRQHNLPPVLGLTWGHDYNNPIDLSSVIAEWNKGMADANRPSVAYGTFADVLRAVEKSGANLKSLSGGVPDWWVYEEWPSHVRAMGLLRQAGRTLPQAETLCVIRSLLEGSFKRYPREKLERAWTDASYTCHTMVPAPKPAPDASMLEAYQRAADVAGQESAAALAAIAAQVEFKRQEQPLVVYNPLSWSRTDPVEVVLPESLASGARVLDPDGREVPSQFCPGRRLTFVAENVPAMGYRSYYLAPATANGAPAVPGVGTKWTELFETPHFRATPGAGGLAGLVDRQSGKEVFSTDRWQAGEWTTFATNAMGACEGIDFAPHPETFSDRASAHKPAWTCDESGPVFVRFSAAEIKSKHCAVRTSVTFYRALRRVDWTVRLTGNDQEIRREQRIMFPIRAAAPEFAYEVPFGVVEPGRSEPFVYINKGRYAPPGAMPSYPREIQNWVYAAGDGLGVTIGSPVGACAFGDFGAGADKKLAVVAPILLAGIANPQRKSYSQTGDFEFTFSLFTHQPGYAHGARWGVQSQTPMLVALPTTRASKPTLPASCSFFSVDSASASLTAVKKAEDDGSVVFRLCERAGVTGPARIISRFEVKEARLADLLERGGKPLDTAGGGITVPLGAWSVETVKAMP